MRKRENERRKKKRRRKKQMNEKEQKEKERQKDNAKNTFDNLPMLCAISCANRLFLITNIIKEEKRKNREKM